MTTGEGGMITTNDTAIAEKIRLLRSHGMTSLTWEREQGHSFSYNVVALGYNYRIDELRSAIGLAQLKKLDENNRKREEVMHIYREKFGEFTEILCPFPRYNHISSHHLFPILLNRPNGRDSFMKFMKDKGIQTSIHYPPVHKFDQYISYAQNEKLPLTNNIANRLVTLPLYPGISRDQIDYIVESTRQWLASYN
jgi:dTDP-4-amino-4,6-dideoxygalactose transaminase